MASVRTIKTVFAGDSKPLAKTSKDGEKAISGWQSGMQKFAKVAAAAMAAVGAAVVTAGKFLFNLGSQFNEATRTIRIGTGATGAALAGLKADFKAVARAGPAAFSDVATAIADLNTRTGQAGPQLRELATAFLDLQRITGEELATSIPAITRVFGDWGIETRDQVRTMDKLFRASQNTGIGVTRLSEHVVQFGAPLRQMGFSFEQSIAMLAKWEKEGVNTELVMGSLRIALGKLARSGREPVSAFREQVRAIKAAGDAGKANALALELFGARAGPDMAAAIREGRFEIDSLMEAIASGGDTVSGLAAETAKLTEKWQTFKNRVLVGLEPLATKVFGALEGSVTKFADKAIIAIDRFATRIQTFIDTTLADLRADFTDFTDHVVKGLESAFATANKAVDGSKTSFGGLNDSLKTFMKTAGPVLEWVLKIQGAIWFLALTVINAAIKQMDMWRQGVEGLINVFKRATEGWQKLIDKIRGTPGGGQIFGAVTRNSSSGFQARAHGGSALANRDYLVGEEGPEILRMGSRSGTVIPNDQIGRSGDDSPMVIENHIHIGDEVVRVVRTVVRGRDRNLKRAVLAGAGAR